MLTNFLHTAFNVSNGIVSVTNRIAVIPAIAKSNNNNSRLNKAGFFMSVMVERCALVVKRLHVSVYSYAAISLLPNVSNYRPGMLKRVNR
jgi:hypothetical protein